MSENKPWKEMANDVRIGPFEPEPYYDPDSDTLTLVVKDDPVKRERVNRYLTVYRSRASNDVVGCLIKDVRKDLLSDSSGFKINIAARELTLDLLLYSLPLKSGGYFKVLNYCEVLKPLMEAAEDVHVNELIGAAR